MHIEETSIGCRATCGRVSESSKHNQIQKVFLPNENDSHYVALAGNIQLRIALLVAFPPAPPSQAPNNGKVFGRKALPPSGPTPPTERPPANLLNQVQFAGPGAKTMRISPWNKRAGWTNGVAQMPIWNWIHSPPRQSRR